MLRVMKWAIGGLALTPFLEYAWHAWIGHGKRPNSTREEHLKHHYEAHTVKDPWQEIGENTGRIVGTLLALNAAVGPFVGLKRTIPLSAGLALGYALTTLYHAQMHQRAPKTPYEEWMWRFHWHHHAADARVNFGLTNPAFDFLFGTAVVPEEVQIPPRLVPSWLTEERPGFRFRRPTP